MKLDSDDRKVLKFISQGAELAAKYAGKPINYIKKKTAECYILLILRKDN